MFDENWQVIRSHVDESYHAKYGPISAGCVSSMDTIYEYGTANAESDAYSNYFEKYVGSAPPNNDSVEKEITTLNCLAEVFGSILSERSVLNLDLDINGRKENGIINVDLSKANLNSFDLNALNAKARIGSLELWLDNGNAYIRYGSLQLSLKAEELINLIAQYSASETFDAGVKNRTICFLRLQTVILESSTIKRNCIQLYQLPALKFL